MKPTQIAPMRYVMEPKTGEYSNLEENFISYKTTLFSSFSLR